MTDRPPGKKALGQVADFLDLEWSTNASLARYLRSDLYRAILAIIESASEPPELRFDTIVTSAGVELLKIVRGVP